MKTACLSFSLSEQEVAVVTIKSASNLGIS